MNKPMVQTYKSFRDLRNGDQFTMQGEVARFVNYTDRTSTACGITHRQAHVINGDRKDAMWWICQSLAGTVTNTMTV